MRYYFKHYPGDLADSDWPSGRNGPQTLSPRAQGAILGPTRAARWLSWEDAWSRTHTHDARVCACVRVCVPQCVCTVHTFYFAKSQLLINPRVNQPGIYNLGH